MKLGAQLYTVNKRLKTPEDLEDAFRKMTEIGYRSVQIPGIGKYDPFWLRDKLQEYGLECALTHVPGVQLLEEPEKTIRDHAIFGCKNIGLSCLPQAMQGTTEGYERFRDAFVPVSRKFHDLGATFHFHNHDYDFKKLEGGCVFQRVLEDFPETLEFTLDLGWAAFAGEDVIKLIDLLKGRLSRIHLKDYADMPADGSITTRAYLRPIYEGKLPYDDYIKALANAGTEHMLVEQDYCYDEDGYECLRRSFDNVVRRFPKLK